MSLKKSYNLIINNIENFTLTKDKNNTIFDIRKTARYKYKNHNNKICSTKSIERKDLIINKIINLNFIQIVKKLNIFNNSENPLINKNNIKIENKPFFLNNNKQNNYNALNNNKSKYCKKNKNKKVQKNVLIKPIMVEGNNNPIICIIITIIAVIIIIIIVLFLIVIILFIRIRCFLTTIYSF